MSHTSRDNGRKAHLQRMTFRWARPVAYVPRHAGVVKVVPRVMPEIFAPTRGFIAHPTVISAQPRPEGVEEWRFQATQGERAGNEQ